MKLAEALALQLAAEAKPKSKYHARAVVVDGVRFHSAGEAKRWGELRLLERGKHIRHLRRQVPFKLLVNDILICTYVADFVYTDYTLKSEWEVVVEDFKSPATRKLPEYRLKYKLMQAIYGITIFETGKKG